MASLSTTINDSDLDEDEMFAAAIRMSMGQQQPDTSTTTGGDDLLLQQALAASLSFSQGTHDHDDNSTTTASPLRAASPVLHDQLLCEKDVSQAELMERIEETKREASSSAKQRRKSAKKLAKRNSRNGTGSAISISTSINSMDMDELRSELRRLCVPLPWPPNQEGLSSLLFSVVSERSLRKKKKEESPIRQRKNSKSSRNSRKKNKRKGAGRGMEPVPVAPDLSRPTPSMKVPLENMDTDDLLLRSIIAQSLRERGGGSGGGITSQVDVARRGMNDRQMHQSFAVKEQIRLERAMEENNQDHERQLIFSSLKANEKKEAEIQWKKYMEKFQRSGGRKPTTDFIVSLAKDIVARKHREERDASEAEEKEKVVARNNETREERANRFAAAYEARQGRQKSTPG